MSPSYSLAKISGGDDVSRWGAYWKFRATRSSHTTGSNLRFTSVQTTPAMATKGWAEWLQTHELTQIEFTGKGTKPKWVKPVVASIRTLLGLMDDWDSYGGKPITAAAVSSALRFLQEKMTDSIVLPWIVPTSKGGLQLEWHKVPVDIEIEIGPLGEVSIEPDPPLTGSQNLNHLFKHLTRHSPMK